MDLMLVLHNGLEIIFKNFHYLQSNTFVFS